MVDKLVDGDRILGPELLGVMELYEGEGVVRVTGHSGWAQAKRGLVMETQERDEEEEKEALTEQDANEWYMIIVESALR